MTVSYQDIFLNEVDLSSNIFFYETPKVYFEDGFERNFSVQDAIRRSSIEKPSSKIIIMSSLG